MTTPSLHTDANDRPIKPARKKRWPYYVVGGFAAFLVLLPVGIKFGAQYALKEFGAETAQITDVDLNLFAGTFAIKGLQVTYQQKPTLSFEHFAVNLSMLALVKQRILVEDVQLSGLALEAYQHDDHWVIGIPLPQSEETTADAVEEPSEPSNWTVGVNNIGLHNIAVNALLEGQSHSVRINELIAQELLMWTPEHKSHFRFDGSVNDAAIQLDSGLTPFAETQQFSVSLTLNEFNLGAFSAFLPDDIHALKARLSIDTELDVALAPNGDISLNKKGYVALALDELAITDIEVAASDIRWEGEIHVQLPADKDPIINAEGTASVSDLNAHYTPLLVNARFDRLAFDGKAYVETATLDDSLQVTGAVTLAQFALYDNMQENNLASFEALNLSGIAVNGLNDIQLDAINLKQLKALQQKNGALAGMGNIAVNNSKLSLQNHAVIKEVVLDTLAVNLRMNEHGKIVVLDEWLESLNKRLAQAEKSQTVKAEKPNDAESSTASVEPEKTAAEPFHYRVENIRFAGNNSIRFTDDMVKPAVVHPVDIKTLNIGAIDSQKTSSRTPIDVQLKLYKFGSFNVKGDITPLADTEKLSGDIAANIAGIELADLSYYLENAIGYQANSGQLNVVSNAKLNEGQLDSETKVTIQRIDLKPANQEIIEKINQHLSMPISTVLMIITDSNNTLNLTVPVKGDLSNPDVKIGRIASGALLQAVKNSAMTYFKYAVQPFGAILMVSETIGDMHLQARFEDIRFVPGQAQIIAEQDGYLEKIAGMIKAKKNFSIVACVMITEEDFAAREKPKLLAEGEKLSWDAESEALAEARSHLIREALIEQFEVPVKQIQSCKPLLGKGLPRAALGI